MNWTDLNISKEEYYKLLSLITINTDCLTIKEIMIHYKDPILSLGFLPYLALFCNEAESFLEHDGVKLNIQNSSPFKIEQARLKLKQFNDKFGKATRYVTGLDESQDNLFRKRLRLDILRKFNLHYNLGLYYYNESIIGNTQYFYSLFQGRKLITKRVLGEDVKEFAKTMGEIVGTISQLLDSYPRYIPQINEMEFSIYYQDINTNRRQIFRVRSETSKSIQLFLLHTLCNINFVRLIVNPILQDSIWKMRVMYIAMYYADEQIKLIKGKSNDNIVNAVLEECMNKLSPVFSFDFRSCMMHYSFINKGKCIIDDQYSDFELPMFGLIESCFNGMHYDELQRKIISNLDIMAKSIEELLVLNTKGLTAL